MSDWGMRTKVGGVMTMDITTNMARILGTIDITSDGSTTVPGFADGIPDPQLMVMGLPYWLPELTVSGTTLSWSYGSTPVNSPGGRTPCTILLVVR